MSAGGGWLIYLEKERYADYKHKRVVTGWRVKWSEVHYIF